MQRDLAGYQPLAAGLVPREQYRLWLSGEARWH